MAPGAPVLLVFARKTLWSGPPVPSVPSSRGCTRAGESRSFCSLCRVTSFGQDASCLPCLRNGHGQMRWGCGHMSVPPHGDLVGRVVFFLGALILGRTKPLAGAGWHAASPPSQHLEISETHAAKLRLKKLLVVQEHLLDRGERKAFHSSLSFGASRAPFAGAGALPALPCKGTLKARGSGYLDTPSI